VSHGFDVRPDLCAVDNKKHPKDYIGKFYIDSLVHDPKMLEYIVDVMGADKIALGTDYPFPLGELQPGQLINSMSWDDAQKEQLLSKSALDWLGMEKEDFL